MRDERTFLYFEDKGIRLQTLYGMPCVFWNVHADSAFIMTEYHRLYYLPVVIVSADPHPSFQENESLIFCHMVMNGYLRSHFQCVEEPMALVVKALMEVVVHPQAWRFPCFFNYSVYQMLVDYLHVIINYISHKNTN